MFRNRMLRNWYYQQRYAETELGQVCNYPSCSIVFVLRGLAIQLDSKRIDLWVYLLLVRFLLLLLPIHRQPLIAIHVVQRTIYSIGLRHYARLALQSQQHGHRKYHRTRLHTGLKNKYKNSINSTSQLKTHTSAAICSSTRSRIKFFKSCLSFKISRISSK